jgi:hypothetical protein
MTIFVVEKYVVKPDKMDEFTQLIKEFKAWMKKRPELFSYVKSYKVFSHLLGGTWGGGVWMTEVESLADFEKGLKKQMESKEFMTEIYAKFMATVVDGTYSIDVWTPVP